MLLIRTKARGGLPMPHDGVGHMEWREMAGLLGKKGTVRVGRSGRYIKVYIVINTKYLI